MRSWTSLLTRFGCEERVEEVFGRLVMVNWIRSLIVRRWSLCGFESRTQFLSSAVVIVEMCHTGICSKGKRRQGTIECLMNRRRLSGCSRRGKCDVDKVQ